MTDQGKTDMKDMSDMSTLSPRSLMVGKGGSPEGPKLISGNWVPSVFT